MTLLSACLITKNEAARLPRCLDSLVGVVDEVVVVDTGSSDNTVEIAKAHGARVSTFSWIDDFSAARNVALDLARGQWILSIDADEWLRPGSSAALRAALDRVDVLAFKVTLWNHLDGERHEEERLTRLFRRDPRIRFEGRVHEQVTETLAPLVDAEHRWIELEGVALEHDGYLRTIMIERGKEKRNIALLERAVIEAPKDAYLRYKLAMELGERGGLLHLETALELLLAHPASEIARHPWAEQALINGALQLAASGRPAVVETVARACVAAFGAHPALTLARARAEVALGHPKEALALVVEAEAAGVRGPSFDLGALTVELCLTAAEAHRLLRQYEPAIDRLQRARQAQPGAAAPVHKMMELAMEIGDMPSALRLGLTRLKEHPDDAGTLTLCALVAERCGDLTTARRWRTSAAAARAA